MKTHEEIAAWLGAERLGITVPEWYARKADRERKANKAESGALRSFEPVRQDVAELRPASTNPSGADLHGGDSFRVPFTDGQGATSNLPPQDYTTPIQTERGPVAVKGKDMSKCVAHAQRIANIHAQSDFSEAAKSTAIRGANEQHAPECAGLCDQTGSTTSKAVAYDLRSETQRVAAFTSTNVPGRT